MTRRTISIVYSLIVAWMFLPLVPVIIAGIIATICGVQLDEGSAHPCIVLGTDFGETLYCMGVMGWFCLMTFPTGILAMIVFTPIVIISKRASRPC